MGEHRRLDIFDEVNGLRAAAVKDHDRFEPAHLRCGREGHLAAPAKADEALPVASDVGKSPKISKARIGILGHVLPGGELTDVT